MIGYDIGILLGFFIGAVLHAVLLTEIWRRQVSLLHEWIFLALVLVMTLFNGLQFIALSIKEILGKDTYLVYSELRYYSLIVIGFLPPLLVHVHASFLDHVRGSTTRFRQALPLTAYLPIVVLIYFADYSIVDARNRVIDENLSLVPPFVFWLTVCLGVCVLLSLRIIRWTRNEKWRQFFTIESAIIVIIIGLLAFFYFGGGTGNVRLDKTLKGLLRVTALLPTLALIFLLYKYPFYSIVARRRLLFVILAGSFFSVYLIASRAVRQWAEDRPDINSDTLEIVLVAFIFVLYEPVKYIIRRIAGYYALHQKSVYQRTVRRITERIVSAPNTMEIAKLLQQSLRELLQVDDVGLFTLATQTVDGKSQVTILHTYGDIRPFDVSRVARAVMEKDGIFEAKRVNVLQLRATEIPYRLYAAIVLDGELVGLLAIGKKKNNEEFSFEEKELLLTVSSQVAIAIENIELVQRRLELETRMFEADKLSSLGMLSTSIAHEVKNPLSSIKSIVQSMLDERTNGHEDSRRDLEVIEEEINRLTQVVDQLLRFAKPERQEANAFDVCRTLDAILTIMRPEIRNRGITVYVNYVQRPLCMKTNQADLKEILFNVIINAVQAMESGGRLMIKAEPVECEFAQPAAIPVETGSVQVSDLLKPDPLDAGYALWQADVLTALPIEKVAVKSLEPSSQGNCVRLSITDSGPGIPREKLEDIFKPFYTTKSSGTGLGLAIVKSKTEALNGRLVLKSHEGLGTTFDLYIPVQARPDRG